MQQIEPGTQVQFFTDKRSAARDLESYAHMTGHGLDGLFQDGDLWRVTLRARLNG